MTNCNTIFEDEQLQADIGRYGFRLGNENDHTVDLLFKNKVIAHFTANTSPNVIRGYVYDYLAEVR